MPPAASAVHIDGERAYKRFRRGEEVEMPERAVTIHAIELLAFDPVSQTADLDVHCSTGTYIRALARDLGARGRRGRLLQRAAPHRGGAVLDRRRGRSRTATSPPPCARPPTPCRTCRGARSPLAEVEAIGHGRRIEAHDEPAGPVVLLDGERLVAIGTRDGDTPATGPVFA